MNYFKNNKSFRILKPIKSLLPENIKKIIKNDKRFNNNLNTLKKDWRNIVENEVIKICEPVKINKNHNGYCLHLQVEKSMILEVDYLRDELINKINSFYGFNYIQQIMINTVESNKRDIITKSNLTNKNNLDKIKKIKNEKLRSILENFDKKNEMMRIVYNTLLIFFLSLGAQAQDFSNLSFGNSSAKVKLKIYSSLTCPYCAEFHMKTLPKLLDSYVAKNMMYIEIMDFPLDYAALNAAKIQKCLSIERQEEYLNNIYSNQSKWSNAKTLEKINENLKNIFLEYNPNNSKFEECLKNKKIENHVLQDRIDAQKKYKIDSTPSVVINEKKYSGSLKFDDLRAAINKLL